MEELPFGFGLWLYFFEERCLSRLLDRFLDEYGLLVDEEELSFFLLRYCPYELLLELSLLLRKLLLLLDGLTELPPDVLLSPAIGGNGESPGCLPVVLLSLFVLDVAFAPLWLVGIDGKLLVVFVLSIESFLDSESLSPPLFVFVDVFFNGFGSLDLLPLGAAGWFNEVLLNDFLTFGAVKMIFEFLVVGCMGK